MKNIIYLLFLLCVSAYGQEQYGYVISQQQNENVDVVAMCNDGIQNGSETGVDCGGICSPCSQSGGKTIARPNVVNLESLVAWDVTNEYTPTSVSDLENASNAGKVALISNSFSVSGSTFAANQIIVPQGGSLTGTGINLNGATIVVNHQRAFASSARFSSLYPESKGCLFPELFGAATDSDDADALEAMMLNGNCGLNENNATYVVATNKIINRSGIFKWSGNNSKADLTFIDSGTSLYALRWDNLTIEITDLVFDGLGTHVTGSSTQGCKRALYSVNGQFRSDNITVKNLVGTTGANSDRVIGINIYTNLSNGGDYQIYNSTFDKIVCYGSGTVASNSLTGLSKAIYVNYKDLTTSSTNDVDFDNITINEVIGDDADGIFFSSSFEGGAGRYVNNLSHRITNSTFSNCARRFVKGIESQIIYTNNVFNSMSPSQVANGLGNVYPSGSTINSVDVSGQNIPFTPTAGVTIGAHASTPITYFSYGSSYINNTFNAHSEGMVQNFIGGSEWHGTLIQGNIFNSPSMSTSYEAISIGNTGSQPGSKYDGVVIENNDFTNCGISFNRMASEADYGWTKDFSKQVTIQNNDFDYSVINTGGVVRALITTGVSNAIIRDVWFINNTVDFNYTSSYSNFGGLVGPRWAGPNFVGVHLEDNTLNLTGNTTNQKFTNILGDFGSGNSIKNNVANGMTAANAIKIDGAQNFENVNNVNGNYQTLTVQ